MQKQSNATFDLGITVRVAVAAVAGAIIAGLLVQIGLELGAIRYSDEYVANEVVGIVTMIATTVLAAIAINSKIERE